MKTDSDVEIEGVDMDADEEGIKADSNADDDDRRCCGGSRQSLKTEMKTKFRRRP
jgi:hypothetical protein